MEYLNHITDHVFEWVPTAIWLSFFILGLYVAKRVLFENKMTEDGQKILIKQFTFIGLIGIAVIIVILSLPIEKEVRSQLLSLIGIFLTAAVALSSTTFLGNLMGGFMLRSINGFAPGDFIEVKDIFGRVSEYGFLHTEVQTDDSNLTTLPNLYLVTNPVKVYRSSGTVIWAEVSLGYDNRKDLVVEKLKEAAESIGLESVFVHAKDLGDFSIVYRVSGFLKDIKSILSSRSNLRFAMMEKLHMADIEIVSPTFMNQRVYEVDRKFLSKSLQRMEEKTTNHDEDDLIFEKASKLESIEEMKSKCAEFQETIKEAKKQASEAKDETEKEKIHKTIERYEKAVENLNQAIEKRVEKFKKEED